MRPYRIRAAPCALRQKGVQLDNLTLVPASLLPFKDHWQHIANDLPDDSVLIVLPSHAKQRHVAHAAASRLRQKGKRVMVMNQEYQ